jgi:hypothetical protein
MKSPLVRMLLGLAATHALGHTAAAQGPLRTMPSTPQIERQVAREVTLRAANLASLERTLAAFVGGLTQAERQVWNRVVRNAALAPSENPRAVRVQPIVSGPGTPGAATPDRLAGIIVQGGRESIGPKQDDPGTPPSNRTTLDPRQDGPTTAGVARKLQALAAGLPLEERAGIDWLLSRATTGGRRPGTPGGAPPEVRPSLRQALGIDPLAIGPKQDDPRPPAPDARWVLRF